MQESLPLQDLPTSLYSLRISNNSLKDEDNMMRIPFGHSITVQFTGCRETMKRKDWIGIEFGP